MDGKRILDYMVNKGYKIFDLNMVVMEDSDERGNPIPNTPDVFNDRFLVIKRDGTILHNATCTSEPGKFYTMNPLNPNGAARIAITQHVDVWSIGTHKNQKGALVQTAPITVWRDGNRDYMRAGDKSFTGMFGINIHTTSASGGASPTTVGKWSAGCVVLRFSSFFYDKLVPLWRDYRNSFGVQPGRFSLTVIDTSDFAKQVSPIQSASTQGVPNEAVSLVKKWEGFRSKAYVCPAGVWTCGYGSTQINGRPVKSTDVVNEVQAEKLLIDDLSNRLGLLRVWCKVKLTSGQTSAILSLMYNIGNTAFKNSTLLRLLNSGDYNAARKQLLVWNKVNGRPNQGLINRRSDEYTVWAK